MPNHPTSVATPVSESLTLSTEKAAKLCGSRKLFLSLVSEGWLIPVEESAGPRFAARYLRDDIPAALQARRDKIASSIGRTPDVTRNGVEANKTHPVVF